MTLRWVPGWDGLTEPEAVSYVAAVEAADGQELEFGVARAINDFVTGCKQDKIWDAIKACCILAGARTLDGALVPLVGGAPTNNNFVSGDYDRETGLNKISNEKYLASNRFNNDDPLDNCHISVYGNPGSAYGGLIGSGANSSVVRSIQVTNPTTLALKCNNSTYQLMTPDIGLIGCTRSSPSSFVGRAAGISTVFNVTSASASNFAIDVFQRGSVSGTRCRLAFYSIGESLDLAKLDTRVSNLITAIGAAIP